MRTANMAIASLLLVGCAGVTKLPPKRIAAIVTEYRHNSHADVIVGRLVESHTLDGKGEFPNLKLVSLYMYSETSFKLGNSPLPSSVCDSTSRPTITSAWELWRYSVTMAAMRLGGSLVTPAHPTSNNEAIAILAVLMVGAVCLLCTPPGQSENSPGKPLGYMWVF